MNACYVGASNSAEALERTASAHCGLDGKRDDEVRNGNDGVAQEHDLQQQFQDGGFVSRVSGLIEVCGESVAKQKRIRE